MKFPGLNIFLALVFIIIFIDGCYDDNNPISPFQIEPRIMFINAAPYCDTNYLYIKINNDSLNAFKIKYGDYIGYREYQAGLKNITIKLINDNDSLILSDSVIFETGKYYSFVIYDTGTISSIDFKVISDLPELSNSSSIKVRLVNFYNGQVPLDLYQYPSIKIFSKIKYKEASDFLILEPGSYDFSVKLSSDSGNTILQIFGQNLSFPRAYSFFISGYAENAKYIKTIF